MKSIVTDSFGVRANETALITVPAKWIIAIAFMCEKIKASPMLSLDSFQGISDNTSSKFRYGF